jgi:PAS domain S-box-containing protein
VDVSLSVIPLGGKQVIYTVWRDITDRKKMEENLAAQARRFLALVENAPFGAMLLDRDRKCTYTNAKFRELFGYDLEDVPDQQVWLEKAYPDPEYRSSVIATWHNEIERFSKNSSIREGEHWTFTVTCKNGRQKIANVIPVQLPTGEYLKTYADITEQKKAEEALKSREAELAAKSASLQDVNAALRVLLNERERDRMELEEKIASNVDKLVLPYVKELKKCHLDPPGMSYVEAIETGLDHIVSPFLQRLTVRCGDLTPREMKIADLVKTGKTTKEIGQLLRMTPGAVNFHRNNIRKKLGLNNRRVNLTSYLSSLK